jgi:hypothetical protein|tara:strand:+ start:253 stop:1200 length:948 start_codon:yes stop_codon:yes gene_type:complete
MKITKEQIKETLKLVMNEEADYKVFFKKALEKAGKSIPSMSDDEKKAFFNKIDTAWDAKGEVKEGNAFGAAVVAAKEAGEDEFEVDGEKFKVEESHSDCGCGCGGVTEGGCNTKSVNEAIDFAGWVAIDHKGKRLEIKKSEAKDLYNAKLLAIKKLKVPKSKESMLAIKPAYNESVNEASKEAMGIAALTGTRGSAVEDFILKHELDGKKLFKSITKANLRGRLNFVSALAGKDGNPNQKLTIKLHKENFNEELSTELAFEVITFMERPVMETVMVDEFEKSDIVEMLVNEGINDVLTEGVKAEFNTLVETYNKK